jgi:hypothetical protein
MAVPLDSLNDCRDAGQDGCSFLMLCGLKACGEDAREWGLEDALGYFSGTDEATYISCVPGKLALFAAFKTRHILAR